MKSVTIIEPGGDVPGRRLVRLSDARCPHCGYEALSDPDWWVVLGEKDFQCVTCGVLVQATWVIPEPLVMLTMVGGDE